ncbi:MAG: hypothetical protein JWN29_2791 [Acidimicrobiales bacterium]|nr:hypothetical protein [Acidimicrobiales bacterium]
MNARLRRLPIGVAVGGLWAVLDPNGRWYAAVLGGVVVLVLPEVQPWVLARLQRPGEVPASLRHPGEEWVAGTVKVLDDGGLRWRATVDAERSVVRITTDRFTFGGYLRDEPVAGREVLELRAASGQLELAVPPEQAERLAAVFRIATG